MLETIRHNRRYMNCKSHDISLLRNLYPFGASAHFHLYRVGSGLFINGIM